MQKLNSAQEVEIPPPGNNVRLEAFAELERGVNAALETYSNVHRGSGHNSMVTTYLYEQARNIVLEYLGLNKSKHTVIFCSPRRAEALRIQLKPNSYKIVSSQDLGLPLGVRALAVKRKYLPGGIPFQTGGGTTRLVSPAWIIWADAPDRFEAGTPSIVNVIAFARALQLINNYGNDAFRDVNPGRLSANEILYHDELEIHSGQKLLDELRRTMIGQGILVPTLQGTMPYINLDNAASTPTFAPIWKAVCQTWHQPKQVQQEIVHEVRSICANFLGASLSEYDVIFTSNTTEAINLAAESLSRESKPGTESVVINTLIEHNSNDLPWRNIPNFSLIRINADPEGFLDITGLDKLLCAHNSSGEQGNKRIRLVAVSGASNVLGVFNNLEEISRIVHSYGARLLIDAAQLVAHRKVELERWGIDYFAFSAHKVYAPFGIGILLVRKGLLNFSSAELGLIQSSGEENTVGISALGKALVILERIGLDLIRDEEQALTGRILRGMAKIKNLSIYGIKDTDSPRFTSKSGVIVFSLKNIFSNVIARELAERRGIGIRYGCHCAHILIKHLVGVGPFLERFQGFMATLFPEVKFPGLARVSLGIGNSEEDIENLINELGKIATQQRIKTDRRSTPGHYRTPKMTKKEIKQQMDDFVGSAAQRVYSVLKSDPSGTKRTSLR